ESIDTCNVLLFIGVCQKSGSAGVGTSSTLLLWIYLFAFTIQHAILVTLETSDYVKVLLAANPHAPSILTLTENPKFSLSLTPRIIFSLAATLCERKLLSLKSEYEAPLFFEIEIAESAIFFIKSSLYFL